MTLKYAIRRERTAPVTPEEQIGYKVLGYSEHELEYAYEEVPKHVADEDAENGMFAMFCDGVRATEWIANTYPSLREPEEKHDHSEAILTYTTIILGPLAILGAFMLLMFAVDSLMHLG